MTDLAHGAEELTAFAGGAPSVATHATTVGARAGDPEMAARTRRAQRALRLAIGYTPRHDLAAARIALSARIQALEACLECRKPKLKREVRALLDGARELLPKDDAKPVSNDAAERLEAAATQYRTAQKVYHGYVQKANRPLYAGGVLFGAVVLAVLPFLFYAIAKVLTNFVDERAAKVFAAADLPSMLILFGFAGLGSLASVLTRLDKIATSDMFTWHLVFLSGAGRPLVAATFATVIYALFKGHIISLGVISHSSVVAGGPQWWCFVIAFLCGYSERFAEDLLGRSPLGGDSAAAAPTPVKSTARMSGNGAEPRRPSDGGSASLLNKPRRGAQRTHFSAPSASEGTPEVIGH
jgi:hypothetical protein